MIISPYSSLKTRKSASHGMPNRRSIELNFKWGTICTPVEMLAPDGKRRKTQAADLEGIFRIIQSIPSKKAEPVKKWLAEIGAQRIDQMIDPELTFQMAVEDYRRQK